MTHLCHMTKIWQNEKWWWTSHFFVVLMTNSYCHAITISSHPHFQLRFCYHGSWGKNNSQGFRTWRGMDWSICGILWDQLLWPFEVLQVIGEAKLCFLCWTYRVVFSGGIKQCIWTSECMSHCQINYHSQIMCISEGNIPDICLTCPWNREML